MKLMIVESPHKAKVIGGFLPKNEYIVDASVGHIRELPEAKRMTKTEKEKYTEYAIDVNGNFDALYKVSADKTAVVKRLKTALLQCDEVLLATDPDREGEAISWHLIQLFAPEIKRNSIKVSRVTWQEITKEAVYEGLKKRRSINMHEVDAALARSHYDRLFGYSISPVLWRTVGPATSGGRVQSPVLRLVVNREKERLSFIKAEYMTATGRFAVGSKGTLLNARLISLGERKFATGESFDSRGMLKNNAVVINSSNWSKLEASVNKHKYAVSDVTTRPYTRSAPPPYTTSSLQQDVGTRLGISTKQIMNVAQRLYEAGLTTYMRTDSVTLSQEAVKAARSDAVKFFGANAVPATPNLHKNRGKNTQEGHEALRPSVVNNSFQTPRMLKAKLDSMDKYAYRVYECIYNRTVASQMNPAKGLTTTVKIESQGTLPEQTYMFATSATVINEPGWTALTKLISEDDEDNATLDDYVSKGEKALLKNLQATEHSTAPPPRWTEAKLVQELADLGIGRPATYASMVTVNQTRGYVKKKGQQLYPTWKGMKIAQYLERYTPSFVAYDATAQMEEELDKIEEGSLSKQKFLSSEWNKIKSNVLPLASNIDWAEINQVSLIKLNDVYGVRVNNHGAWLEKLSDEYDENGFRKGVPLDENHDVANIDFSNVQSCNEIFDSFTPKQDSKELGELTQGPYAGWSVTVKDGRYGAYLQAVNSKNKKAAPVNNKLPDGVHFSNITLADAEIVFGEIKLPRSLDDHFFVGIGKRGPWLGYKSTPKSKKAVFVSLPENMNPRTMTLQQAQEVWDAAEAKKADSKNTSGNVPTARKRTTKKTTAKKSVVRRRTSS